MQRVGGLWDELTSFENLLRAYRKARRGKRQLRSVERFEYNREGELARLQRELQSGTYQPGPYRTFMLHDGKPRQISAAPFRDRVVHHAFCNVVEPVFEHSFIHDSYASRRGKGTHSAIRRYQRFARSRSFVLKCDIRKFFPSIDHQILMERLARRVKDRHVLALASLIIAHSNPQIEVSGYFPGDDLWTQSERRRGLPIGNQTSQFFGNVYLDALDHFVKEELGCSAYLRYVDDFVILDPSKERLHEVRDLIEAYLRGLRLWLHPGKRVISRVDEGLRLLGFRVWPGYAWLSNDGLRRFKRRMRRYQIGFRTGRLSSRDLTQRILAWLGHAKQAQSYRLREIMLPRIVFEGPCAEPPGASRR